MGPAKLEPINKKIIVSPRFFIILTFLSNRNLENKFLYNKRVTRDTRDTNHCVKSNDEIFFHAKWSVQKIYDG